MKCSNQIFYGVSGGKGHAPEVCGNVVSVLAYQAADDEVLSGEEVVYI